MQCYIPICLHYKLNIILIAVNYIHIVTCGTEIRVTAPLIAHRLLATLEKGSYLEQIHKKGYQALVT